MHPTDGREALLPERALSFASKTAFPLTPRNVQMPMSSSTSGQDTWSPASPIRQVARAATAAFARRDDQAVGIAKRRSSSRSTEMKASVTDTATTTADRIQGPDPFIDPDQTRLLSGQKGTTSR